MHSELRFIQNQKEELKRRLNQMDRKVKRTKRIKNERTEPWNKKKFLLLKKNQHEMGSTLVNQGLLRPSAKKKSSLGGRGSRGGLLRGGNTWGQGDFSSLSRSNLKRPRSKRHIQLIQDSHSNSRRKHLRKTPRKSRESNFKEVGLRKESPSLIDAVKRREFKFVAPKQLPNDLRNKMIEQEKMSKLFTKDRRRQAKLDFMDRTQFNIEKQKLNKQRLQQKYYDFDFKPEINQRRINIYGTKLHKNVYKKSFDRRRKAAEDERGGVTRPGGRGQGQHSGEHPRPAEAPREARKGAPRQSRGRRLEQLQRLQARA